MRYSIEMDEMQRELLFRALNWTLETLNHPFQAGHEYVAAVELLEMLEELPRVEASSPGVVHCFDQFD